MPALHASFPASPPETPRHASGLFAAARPRRGYGMTAITIAELACERALASDPSSARELAEDAAQMIAEAGDDAPPAAHEALGRALLLLTEAHRAKESFARAARAFDGMKDLARAAGARVALAEALLALGDPSARIVLEDAGGLYEELGDLAAQARVDRALRDADAVFASSPRSFASSSW